MFPVMYRLLEMMALIICLHSLSGEKVKPDIYNVGFIAVELAFMQMIQDGIVSKQMYFLMYMLYFLYAYIKFNETVKRIILKCLLSMLFTSCLQMIIYIPMSFLNYIMPNEEIIILEINLLVFLVIFLTRKNDKYEKITTFCIGKDWILRICLFVCIILVIACMFSLKQSKVINIDIFVLVSIFMTVFAIFTYRWQKSTYELERKEREIKITNLYNGVFEDMIETIKRRQHDFHNQIDAVYSMSLTAESLEELIESQKKYCENLIYENRYTKVLNCVNNSILAGFIYTKFIKAEQYGIEIQYDTAYTENTSISVYDLVEIIGILMDNAIEEVAENGLTKKIIYELNDYAGLKLCISNPIKSISNNDIEKFFQNGYTTKALGSGIGLSKIKEYQKKYNYNIYTQIIRENENEWLKFQIIENK